MARPKSNATQRFEGAFDASRGLVERYVRHRLPEPDASDVLQRIWVQAFERFEQLKDEALAERWLLGIARHAVIDEQRRFGRERLRHCEEPSRPPAYSHPEVRCDCSLAQMKHLPSGQAAVLKRVIVHGDSVGEAARALGISAGSASVRLHRARERMRALLVDHCGVTTMRECQSCGCLESGCCDEPDESSEP